MTVGKNRGLTLTPEDNHSVRLISDGVPKGTHTPYEFDGKSKLGASGLPAEGELVRRADYVPSKRLTPQLNDVMGEAHSIAMNQLLFLREKAEKEPLSSAEVSQFAKLADAIAKLDRTAREREKMRDPNELTDEELMAMADKAREVLTNGRGKR